MAIEKLIYQSDYLIASPHVIERTGQLVTRGALLTCKHREEGQPFVFGVGNQYATVERADVFELDDMTAAKARAAGHVVLMCERIEADALAHMDRLRAILGAE